jgi:hypothetical protein
MANVEIPKSDEKGMNMACVFKRKVKWADNYGKIRTGKTSNYFARFDLGGKQYCIKTGKSSKGEAEKELKSLVAIYRGMARVDDYFNELLGPSCRKRSAMPNGSI